MEPYIQGYPSQILCCIQDHDLLSAFGHGLYGVSALLRTSIGMCSALWGTDRPHKQLEIRSMGGLPSSHPKELARTRRRSANCSLEITRGTGAQYSWSAGPAASQDADGGTLVLRFLSRPGLLLAPVGGNPGQRAREQTLQVLMSACDELPPSRRRWRHGQQQDEEQ